MLLTQFFVSIGRRASEDVILELIRTKCLPVLLYGLEACPLRVSDCNSIDFVVNRFFIKLFKTCNMDVVSYCRASFDFELPSTLVKSRSQRFLANTNTVPLLICFVNMYSR